MGFMENAGVQMGMLDAKLSRGQIKFTNMFIFVSIILFTTILFTTYDYDVDYCESSSGAKCWNFDQNFLDILYTWVFYFIITIIISAIITFFWIAGSQYSYGMAQGSCMNLEGDLKKLCIEGKLNTQRVNRTRRYIY